jgi:hypothetical protein
MLALATVAAAGREYFGKSNAKSAPPAPPPPVVQVIEASARDVMIQSEWVAQTYYQDAVEVRARVNGYIEERRFNAGNLSCRCCATEAASTATSRSSTQKRASSRASSSSPISSVTS